MAQQGILSLSIKDRQALFDRYGLNAALPLLMVVYHPVVQQVDDLQRQAGELLDAVQRSDLQTLILLPNSDAGGAVLRSAFQQAADGEHLHTVVHLPREDYLSAIGHAEVLAGNSSSGIIEAASLGTPVVNIGERQRLRQRNANTIDVDVVADDICDAIATARTMRGQSWDNVYGDGNTSPRIAKLLAEITIDASVLEKVNAY